MGLFRNTSNDQVVHVSKTDQSVREELRQLIEKIKTSLKALEKRFSNVVSVKDAHISTISCNFNRDRNFPLKCHYCGTKGERPFIEKQTG